MKTQQQPASIFQSSLMAVDAARPGFATSPRNTMSTAVLIRGPLDPDRLAAAFADLVHRHDLLRSTIVPGDAGFTMNVHEDVRASLERVDAGGLSPEVLAAAWAAQPVPSERPPLVRGYLARLGPDEHLLGLSFHHLAADPRTLPNATRELATLYGDRLAGRTTPGPAMQYTEYAGWQRERLSRGLADRRAAWAAMMDGAVPAVYRRDFPFEPGGEVRSVLVRGPLLDAAELAAVAAWSRRNRSTTFITLLTAYCRMLAARTDSEDLVVSTAFEQRDHPASAGMIGPFLYPTMLRIRVPEGEPWPSLLARVRAVVLTAYANAQFPLDELIALAPQFMPGIFGLEPSWYRMFEFLTDNQSGRYAFGPAVGTVAASAGGHDDGQEFGFNLRARQTPDGGLVSRMAYDAAELTEASALAYVADFVTELRRFTATSE